MASPEWSPEQLPEESQGQLSPLDPEDAVPFHLDDSSLDLVPVLAPPETSRRVGQGAATALRRELNHRALTFAASHGLAYETTPTASPSILFAPQAPRHGNFFEPSYRAILENPAWAARLEKAHTAHRRVRARADWRWSELDAACSSDALLMNIFCCPGVLASEPLRALLGIGPGHQPEFGYRPRIPLLSGRTDRTEIDLRLGHLLVEAKLTETSFQPSRPALVHRYRDLPLAFDPAALDRTAIPAYQLIRGVLAALAEPALPPATFCVLADRRRPDLVEAWFAVLRTVSTHDLRCRLQMLTWQELATALPIPLQTFLDEKYGIVPAS